MATIFHLALAADWTAAQESGAYTTSTLGRTLADEGFIHASRADQWTAVRERFYADVTEPLVLLQIDTDLLDVPVVEEPAVPGGSETFPHIYGRLPATAVVKAIPLTTGTLEPAPATTTEPVGTTAAAAVPASAQPGESFSRIYFREMFFNIAMLCIVLVAGSAGILVGDGIGGLVGLGLGGAIAVAIYRRRHANVPTD